MVMGATGSKLEKALGEQFPKGEGYFEQILILVHVHKDAFYDQGVMEADNGVGPRIADGAGSYFLPKFRLYETRSQFYMFGRNKSRTVWRVLKINKLDPFELNISEDSTTYTQRECSGLMNRIHEGNNSTGGLKFVTSCYGIAEFIKFLGPYYMLLIIQRRPIGAICGHIVYVVTKSDMFVIPNFSVLSNTVDMRSENMYFASCCISMLIVVFYYYWKQT